MSDSMVIGVNKLFGHVARDANNILGREQLPATGIAMQKNGWYTAVSKDGLATWLKRPSVPRAEPGKAFDFVCYLFNTLGFLRSAPA